MNFSDERYVRVYTRDTESWLMLSWQAQALFLLVLRKVDRAGVLQTRFQARGVAKFVNMPVDVVASALEELLGDGCVQECDSGYVIPNFITAQEAVQSDRFRQRESRARRRAAALGTDAEEAAESQNVTKCHTGTRGVTSGHARSDDERASQNVTECHTASQNVTECHTASQNVTKCHAVSHAVTPAVPSLAVPSLAKKEQSHTDGEVEEAILLPPRVGAREEEITPSTSEHPTKHSALEELGEMTELEREEIGAFLAIAPRPSAWIGRMRAYLAGSGLPSRTGKGKLATIEDIAVGLGEYLAHPDNDPPTFSPAHVASFVANARDRRLATPPGAPSPPELAQRATYLANLIVDHGLAHYFGERRAEKLAQLVSLRVLSDPDAIAAELDRCAPLGDIANAPTRELAARRVLERLTRTGVGSPTPLELVS